jgi:ketosteroid isomerase-like protein
MSERNAESFRNSIEAFNRRELDLALNQFHPDIEWEPHINLVDVGTYHGHKGVREFWQQWFDTMDDFQLTIEECVDVGEGRVFAATAVAGRGRGSGVPVEGSVFQVCDYRDGKAYRVRMFASRSAALEAVD